MGGASAAWAALDDAWQRAFEMAWEAVVTGNIGVGCAITDAAGTVVVAARNRTMDTAAPRGQVAGSSVAHAEINALGGLAFRSPREHVLTSTLHPCLQCAAAIRMAPIASVRFAGDDPLWPGSDDFGVLNSWLARRERVPAQGPRRDELGVFGTLLARIGPGLESHVEEALRSRGEGELLDLQARLAAEGAWRDLATSPVDEVLDHLWPHLTRLTDGVSELRIDRAAGVQRTELPAASWVEYVPGFVRDAASVADEFRRGLPWEQTEVLRYDKYVPEKRLGTGMRADSHPVTRQTGLHLESRYRVRFDGVAALLYRDGDDFQGLHTDREMKWIDDTLIAIVVLGARRPFVFRPRGDSVPVERVPAGQHPDDVVLTPGEGDLLVMGGASQREWLHGVPAAPGVAEPRISLTWRWTSRRGRPDTAPTFYDGRSFSDGPRRPASRQRRV